MSEVKRRAGLTPSSLRNAMNRDRNDADPTVESASDAVVHLARTVRVNENRQVAAALLVAAQEAESALDPIATVTSAVRFLCVWWLRNLKFVSHSSFNLVGQYGGHTIIHTILKCASSQSDMRLPLFDWKNEDDKSQT